MTICLFNFAKYISFEDTTLLEPLFSRYISISSVGASGGSMYSACSILFTFSYVEHISLIRIVIMAGAAPEGSQFDARQFDAKMTEM